MSEHGDTPQEPGRDRAFLSVFIIAVAICLAIFLGNKGKATPEPYAAAPLGQRGVVVLKHPQLEGMTYTALYGSVVERGGGIKVITPGATHLIPRDQVEYYDAHTDRIPEEIRRLLPGYEEEARPRAARADSPTEDEPVGKPGKVFGTVIDSQSPARVHVGQLTFHDDYVVIEKNYAQIRLPRKRVRWWKADVEGPDEEFWARFPKVSVWGYSNPNQASTPFKAEMAQMQGCWPEAVRCWTEVYRTRGFRADDLRNLRTCVRMWLKFDPEAVQPPIVSPPSPGVIMRLKGAPRVASRLEKVFEKVKDREPIRRMLGGTYILATIRCLRVGLRKTARRLSNKLVEMGGAYAEQGKRFLRSMEGGRSPR